MAGLTQRPRIGKRRKIARRERAYVTKAYYIPRDIALLIQAAADRQFGGNQSAAATAAMCSYLGVEPSAKYTLQ